MNCKENALIFQDDLNDLGSKYCLINQSGPGYDVLHDQKHSNSNTY